MMNEWVDVLALAKQWQAQGQQLALATVIKTWGSAPRLPGSLMLISDHMQLWGSVSAGCVEAVVIEAALEVVQTKQPQLLHFGIANDQAWEVGLMCGGEIDVFVQPWKPELAQVLEALVATETAFELLTVLAGAPKKLGASVVRVGSAIRFSTLPRSWEDRLPSTLTQTCAVFEHDGLLWCGQRIARPPRLVIVGGNHLAVALARQAQLLNYQVVVIEPRPVFAKSERFPAGVEIRQEWPEEAFAAIKLDQQHAIAVLTHDPKFDDPALQAALQSSIGYVGALGSRRTQAERRERLREYGFSEEQIARIRGPIGLDIGAKTPQEIALSIMSEIVAVARGNQ